MSKCKFCIDNDLQDVGSHVITESLIRGAINLAGKTKRGDYEVIVKFSSQENRVVYFGNSVLPEDRTEVLGRPQTESEIENPEENSFIDKKIVCRDCERRFGPVESEFISKIYNQLKTNSQSIKNSGDLNFVTFDVEDSYFLSLLFVLINVWRLSVSDKFSYWKVDKVTEDQIKQYLDKVLDENINSTLEKAKENYHIVNHLKFTLHFLEQTTGENAENLVFFENSIDPNMLFTNQMVILFSINEFSDNEIPDILKPEIKQEHVSKISDNKDLKLHIQYLSNNERVNILQRTGERKNLNTITNYVERFIVTYRNRFKQEPESKIIDKLVKSLDKLITREKGYNQEDVQNLIREIIKPIVKNYTP